MTKEKRNAKRILIVDDHPVMRYGLAQLIAAEEDMEVCGEAGSTAEALAMIDSSGPDLVIVDISLPDRSGLELIKDLQVSTPELLLLVISSHDESLYAERTLRSGARGYVMKEEAAEKLVEAIRVVSEGKIFVSDKMSAHIIEAFSGGAGTGGGGGSRLDGLTDREFEVFQLIGEGKGSREVAQQLGISVSTIDAHRAHIKKKLNLPDGNALVRQAVRWVESQKMN